MSLALVGVVVFGVAHLVTDVIAWDGDALEQFGGIATDSQTLLAGVALIAGFAVVVDRAVPAPMSAWPGAGFVDGWRANPRAQMQPVITALLAVATLTAVAACRQAGSWDFAPKARTIVSLGLLLTPILGALVALMRFLDIQENSMNYALSEASFVLMEVVVAFGLLIVADTVLNSL